GFIGLGIMGKPMARNLVRAGFTVTVHNRSRAKVEELVQDGASRAASPREAASAADIVITMLPNSPDVELVALGDGGIKDAARPGQLFIDMSTINPIVSQKIAGNSPLSVWLWLMRRSVAAKKGPSTAPYRSWPVERRKISSARFRFSTHLAKPLRIWGQSALEGLRSLPTKSLSRSNSQPLAKRWFSE